MFSFFHRNPIITIDCFTDNQLAYEQNPPKKTSKNLPEWWKQLPVYKKEWHEFIPEENRNMRNCFGFVELFKRGIVIRSWSDYVFNVDDYGIQWKCSNNKERNPVVHSKKLYGNGFQNYHHLKLMTPWLFREKSGVNFLFMEATWLLENYPFTILPGIMEFKTNLTTAVNLFFPKHPNGQTYSVYLRTGQPLVQIVPLCDDKRIEIKTHLISTEEYNRLNNQCSGLNFFGGYKAFKKLVHKNEEQSKCPFH